MSDDSSSTNSTISRLVVTIVLSATMGGITFLLWEILRICLPWFYHPRKDDGTPKFSRIPFKWVWDVLIPSDKRLFQSHGPDVVFYLRTVRYVTSLNTLSISNTLHGLSILPFFE